MIFNFNITKNFFIEDDSNYVFNKLQEEIAASQWYIDYKGFSVNDDIFILPVASPWQPGSQYSYILYLDALKAFGDGKHPTTALCLNALHVLLKEERFLRSDRVSMLDIGTGTGILSILASKMGCAEISALDIFPESIENARANAEINGCHNIVFHVTDIALFNPGMSKDAIDGNSGTYNLVTANLLPPVILENMDRISRLLMEGGIMILSGVSDLRATEIEALFAPKGLLVMEHKTRENWHCYVLRRQL
ncbi:MAG: hypothetical protein CVV44_03675 [Spirochaetae bacterium HGW-Spirochaetae-1]|jgi:ribosomal protein L11 methyltransferase|nr:MAG: hypothetical protein CVV44_03675 [Spirochaetae bacterium HGW-Spirochaetae-1]